MTVHVPADAPVGARNTGRWVGGMALAVAGVLLAGAALGLARSGGAADTRTASTSTTAAVAGTAAVSDPLATDITNRQVRLRSHPGDWQSWGYLGLDYVQQAKVTVNPAYYPKAHGALARSMRLEPHGNYIALAGLGALAAARHDFRSALRLTRAAAHIDPYNATIFGAMADALTQLGRYGAARNAITRMLNLHPGTPAFSRLSYAEELSGHVAGARADLEQALEDAAGPSDVAFVRYYLGQLDFVTGHPAWALRQYAAGLHADPAYPDLLEGRGQAEAALGRTAAAVRDYALVVSRVPQPSYVIEYGELLQSLGRGAAARQQYALFGSEVKLFEANGVSVDLEPALFYADHGNPARALRFARAGWQRRPFLDLADALAWALHRNGADRAALGYSRRALSTGFRSALYHFHAGMILVSLGRDAQATVQLRTALRINPHFDPLRAPIARATLARLGAGS